MKKFIFLAISLAMLVSCSNSLKKVSKPVETPSVSLSKAVSKDKKEYVHEKMNDLNLWWQNLENATLMKLIKKSQDYHTEAIFAKNTLKKYYKNNQDSYYKSSWELQILETKDILISSSDSYWYELRTILSAEVFRQMMNYYFASSMISLHKEYANINGKKSSNHIENIKMFETISDQSIKSLELLTNASKKEITELLNSSFSSIGEQIITNSLHIKIPEEIKGDLIEKRPDVYIEMLNLQRALFNSTNNNNYPTVHIDGQIKTEKNKETDLFSVNIKFKEKEENNNIKIDYDKIKKNHIDFNKKLRKVSDEVIFLFNNLNDKEKILQDIFKQQQFQLSIVKKSDLYDLKNKDIYLKFLENSLEMVEAEKIKTNDWINLYKSIGFGFTDLTNGSEIEK